MATPQASDGSDFFEQMFDMAPVSLWLEDYSGLKNLFEKWRAEGVTDLARHLRAEDTRRVHQCMRELEILRVNQHTLDLLPHAQPANPEVQTGRGFPGRHAGHGGR